MIDRHAFGDFALAVILVFPLAALAHSHRTPTHGSTFATSDSRTAPASGRISLLG